MSSLVPILINTLPLNPRGDESDVLVQAEAVREGIRNLDCRTRVIEYPDRFEELEKLPHDDTPLSVFNLVEAVDDQNSLQYMAPQALERLGLPFTGNSSRALRITTDKVLAKKNMVKSGIPTPWWTVLPATGPSAPAGLRPVTRTLIFKPVYEDASVGLREDLIGVYGKHDALDILDTLQKDSGMAYMAEEFIQGREFNLSLLEVGGAPCVLLPVEQDFSGLPAGYPHVVGYSAKWSEASAPSGNIPRRHRFTAHEDRLLVKLRRLAIRCWYLFGLSGYARVDFRVDKTGRPFVLEINANPCLSPDAGLAYAASLMGLSMTDLVCLILYASLRKGGPNKSIAVR